MIGRASRLQAVVRSGGVNVDTMADKNTVQPSDRPLAVKAWAGMCIVVTPDKFAKTAA